MKRLPQAAGALALAAVLLGGVLTPPAVASTVTPNPFTTPLAFRSADGGYVAYRESPEPDDDGRYSFRATRHAELADALTTATRVALPEPGAAAAPVSLPTGDACLTSLPVGSDALTLVAAPDACDDPAGLWLVTREGQVRPSSGDVGLGAVQAADPSVWPNTGLRPALTAPAAPLADRRFDRRPLEAELVQVNDIARTAVITGTATSFASVRVGAVRADVREDGTFRITATRLAIGHNELRIEQVVAGEVVDAVALDADVVDGGRILPAAGPTVDLERGSDTGVLLGVTTIDDFARLEGVAEITAPSGTTLSAGQTTLSAERRGSDGTWAPDTRLDLVGGTTAADGRRASYDLHWRDAAEVLPSGSEVRWTVDVATPASASAAAGSLGFGFSGTGAPSDFRAVGSTPTTITVPPREVTAQVTLPDALDERAVVFGEGHEGARIEVSVDDAPLGTTEVVDEAWALEIDPDLGPDRHVLDVVQSIDGAPAGRTSAEVDFGPAVDLVAPVSGQVVPGGTTVSGTGAPGAEVTVEVDGRSETAAVVDGAWSVEVELPPSHDESTIEVAQRARGDVRSADRVRVVADARQELSPVVVDGPADGWYRSGEATTLSGTATPYARVVVRNQWTNEAGRAVADADGAWSFERAWGPTAAYRLTATQTLVDGRTSSSAEFTLLPLGSFRALEVTSHAANDSYVPGLTTFSGVATPGAWVTATNQWDRRLFATRASQTTGEWSAPAELGPVADYDVRISQTAPDGQPDQVRLRLTPIIGWVPATVTSHVDGGEYVPGPVTLAGAGTPRATIAITNQWGVSMGTTTVGTDGRWSVRRDMGPRASYALTVVQTRGSETNTVELVLNPPAWRALQLLSPEVGDRYEPGARTEFRGVATPHSTVTVTTDLGSVLFQAPVAADGTWSNTRAYGPVRTYTLTIEQAATTDQGDALRFVWAPDIALRPVAVTSHDDGETYRPGPVTLGGTGTPGATVRVTNQWGAAMGTSEVDLDGRWSIQRELGPRSDYILTVQQDRAGETDETRLTLLAPVWQRMTIDSPVVDDGYDRDVDVRFAGRATPFATIDVSTASGVQLAAPTADRNGDWSFTRRFGPEHVYTLVFTQQAAGHADDALDPIRFGPAGARGASGRIGSGERRLGRCSM